MEAQDKFLTVLDRAEKAVATLVDKYGQEAVDVAMTAARVEVGGSLLLGFAGAVFAGYVGSKFPRWYKMFQEKNRDYAASHRDEEVPYFVAMLVGGLTGVVATIIALVNLLDFWNWAILFDPRLALAKKLFGF